MHQLVLLPQSEYRERIATIQSLMHNAALNAMLITDNASKFHICGRVFAGQIYIPAQGEPIFFVRRPVGLEGDGVVYIRKPEQMPETIGALNMPEAIGLELDLLPYSSAQRFMAIFPASEAKNCSPLLRQSRAVKTSWEIGRLKESAARQERVYRLIPKIYRPGMTDVELQIEIERQLRLEGCLGQFRISGDSMELFMGSLLVGDNADNPTPYDFAMGGAGISASLPGGANGTLITPGTSAMIDMNGDFTGYMTDCTRTFALGTLPDMAIRAHQCSIDICRAIEKTATPGTPAKELYELAEQMARKAGLHEYFMGHHQKAGFIGHGVGIEINELPVIAPRSRDILAKGNVIALEPKFVIPRVGALGIENTYAVTTNGLEQLTHAPEQIIYFTN